MNTTAMKREIEDSPFHIFIKPVLENLLSPLFAYIAAYGVYQVWHFAFQTGFVSIYDVGLTNFCTFMAYLALGIAGALTAIRYLKDDALIFVGKMTQQVAVQRLESENQRLKEQIQKLRDEKSNGRFDNVHGAGDYTINANIDAESEMIEPIVLDDKEQKIFDNGMVLVKLLLDGQSMKRDDVTSITEMSQRAWKVARDTLITEGVISNDNILLLHDIQTIEAMLREALSGGVYG